MVSGFKCLDAVQLVETERENVHEYIVFLRQLRNSHLPIRRMPPEILVEIFLRVNEGEESRCPFWLSITHVCHQWRALALSISALWCEVSLFDQFISKLFLERCQSGPLYIHQSHTRNGHMSLEIEQEWQNILDPRTSRMHTINLYGSDAISLWSSLRCFRGPFPSLHSLSLSSGGMARLPWTEPADGFFPALRHVKLYRVLVPWASPIFRNLQTLKLHDQLVSRRSCTMDDFLKVLDQCAHSLEVFSIAFSGPRLPRDTATYPSIGKTVHLSRLQIFDIHHHPIDIAHLLAHVSFPHTAQLSIRYKVPDDASLDRCFPRDTTVFTHLTDITRFKFQANSSSAEIKCENFTLFASIDEEMNEDEGEIPERVSAFLAQSVSRICTPHTVKEMIIECAWVTTILEDDWFQALSRLSGLNFLSFYQYQEDSWTPFGLCAALVKEKDDGSTVCPELQCLVLEDVYFTLPGLHRAHYSADGDQIIDLNLDQDVAKELAECLQMRSSRGSRLRMLKIHRAHDLIEATMPLLDEVVDQVEWDVYKALVHPPFNSNGLRVGPMPDSTPSDSPPSSP